MAKKKQFKQSKEKLNGHVYILKIWIDADVVHKIGTTNRSVLTRALEISAELYAAIGYMPKMVIVREHRVLNNYAVEAELLRETVKYRYDLPCVLEVTGESEMRKMDEQELYGMYDKCILTNYPAVECYKVEI
jgi:hypothetical protein